MQTNFEPNENNTTMTDSEYGNSKPVEAVPITDQSMSSDDVSHNQSVATVTRKSLAPHQTTNLDSMRTSH